MARILGHSPAAQAALRMRCGQPSVRLPPVRAAGSPRSAAAGATLTGAPAAARREAGGRTAGRARAHPA